MQFVEINKKQLKKQYVADGMEATAAVLQIINQKQLREFVQTAKTLDAGQTIEFITNNIKFYLQKMIMEESNEKR